MENVVLIKVVKTFKIQRRHFYYCKVIRNMLQFENFKVDYKIRVDFEILWSLWVSISKVCFHGSPNNMFTNSGKIDSSLMLSNKHRLPQTPSK